MQRSSQIITINKPTTSFFTGRMPFLSPNQQRQRTEGKISHSMDLLTPSSPGSLPTLSLTANRSWLPWGRVAMPLISPLMPVPQFWLFDWWQERPPFPEILFRKTYVNPAQSGVILGKNRLVEPRSKVKVKRLWYIVITEGWLRVGELILRVLNPYVDQREPWRKQLGRCEVFEDKKKRSALVHSRCRQLKENWQRPWWWWGICISDIVPARKATFRGFWVLQHPKIKCDNSNIHGIKRSHQHQYSANC